MDNPLLFDRVGELMTRIHDLRPTACLESFADALLAARPELYTALDRQAARWLAHAQLRLIQSIPQITTAMMRSITDEATFPAVRCALAGALQYLVQPLDLLPDDLPGGVGFVDDCMVLRATVSEYFDILPTGDATPESELRNLHLLALCAPVARLPEFQAIIDAAWNLFHRLLGLPTHALHDTLERLLDSPERFDLEDFAGRRDRIPPEGPDITITRTVHLQVEAHGVHIRLQGGGWFLPAPMSPA